jgi:hypothetical protein
VDTPAIATGNKRLALLIERSAELKRDLVRFARGPRFERPLTAALQDAAGPEGELDEAVAIGVTDWFALQHRLPRGDTVVDRFVASRPDLTAADREMLLGWRDPVEGLFEVRSKDRDAVVLLNLLDDLEYRTYSNVGRAVFGPLPRGAFVHARLVPISPVPGAWLVSGATTTYPESYAAHVAQTAVGLSVRRPKLVFRNPEKIKEGWELMRQDRAAFVEYFGGDELVLPPAEAQEQVNAYRQQRQEAMLASQPGRSLGRNVSDRDAPPIRLPQEAAEFGTIGVIYDETDGLNFYPGYGMLRDLFADPALAARKQYADVLRGYLRSETIGPLPLLRLAVAHPDTVDAVFRKILRKPNFTWSEHGETLLNRRKAWYYEREPLPGFSKIGGRLNELRTRRR